jgi:hypothetical protein
MSGIFVHDCKTAVVEFVGHGFGNRSGAMNRVVCSIALLIVLGSLGGCGNADREGRASESTFLASFSLGPILEANDQYLIARHTISGGAVSEAPIAFFQKHEEVIVKVAETNVSAFMEAVRIDIEQLLTSSGGKIHGRRRGGNDGQGPEGELPNTDYYSFRYSQNKTEGAINIWGVRDAGTNFVLIVLITESQGG